MRGQIGSCLIELVQGDITTQTVTAIVNAANSGLLGGGGVDGAIHDAAGPELLAETQTRYPAGCPTGSAVITAAGNLPAKYVFHAVGPVWAGGQKQEQVLLSSCYQRCLQLAREHHCKSVAFPAISTGAYGYPMDLAATHALTTIRQELEEHQQPELVRIVLFSAGAYGAFARVLETMPA